MTRRRSTARRTPARGGQQGYEPPVTRMRRDERILELALERWSQRQIAAEVGLTQGGVSKALRRILTRRQATLTQEGAEAYRTKLVLRGQPGPPPSGPGLIRPGRGTASASTGPRSATTPSPSSCAAIPRRSRSSPSTASNGDRGRK